MVQVYRSKKMSGKRLPALHSEIFQNQYAMPTSNILPIARNRISKEIIRANIGNALYVERPLGKAGARRLFGKVRGLQSNFTTFVSLRALKLNQWLIATRRQARPRGALSARPTLACLLTLGRPRDILRASAALMREVDNLIDELQGLRKKLESDRDRIQSEIARHSELNQGVMQLTAIISDNVKKLPNPTY